MTWPVYAHAPYERVQAAVTDPGGRRLQIVARYTVGILGADPVTVIVRDAAGVTIAETESARGAATAHSSSLRGAYSSQQLSLGYHSGYWAY